MMGFRSPGAALCLQRLGEERGMSAVTQWKSTKAMLGRRVRVGNVPGMCTTSFVVGVKAAAR